MRVKISDLCLVVAAIALGVRLSMLAIEPFYWPFDNHLSRGMFLGAVVLCPMVFLKQFLFEGRKTQLRFGEWLWVIFCLWFSLVLLLTRVRFLTGLGGGTLGMSVLLYGGMLINPFLLCNACIYWAQFERKNAAKVAVWSDLAGCVITALLSSSALASLFQLPPI